MGLCALLVWFGVYAHESWGQYFRPENLSQPGEASKYALPWLKDCRVGGVGEIVNINYGLGWDGNLYGQIVVHFNTIFHTKEMLDPYRTQRVLPSVVVHFLTSAMPSVPYSTPPATNHDRFVQAIYLFQYYNIAVLLATGALWLLLVRRLQREFHVSLAAQWLGFVLLFVNYALCKYYLYYPMLTDATALLLSMAMLYCYWRGWDWAMLGLVATSFFTWPLLVYQGIVLMLFPRNISHGFSRNVSRNERNVIVAGAPSPAPSEPNELNSTPRLPNTSVIAFAAAMLLFVGVMLYCTVVNTNAYTRPTLEAESLWVRLLGMAAMTIAVAAVLWPFARLFPYQNLRVALLRQRTVLNLALLAVLLAALWFIKLQVQNSSLQPMASTESFLGFHFNVSANKPALWLVAHTVFFGAVIPLLIALYGRFVPVTLQTGLGNTTVVMGGLTLLCFASESRQMVSFLPNLALCLMLAVQDWRQGWGASRKVAFRIGLSGVVVLVVALNLASTKLWMQTNFADMWKSADVVASFTQFPMQRYFMNQGPWMSFPVYFVQGAIVIAVVAVMVVCTRGFAAQDVKSLNNVKSIRSGQESQQ